MSDNRPTTSTTFTPNIPIKPIKDVTKSFVTTSIKDSTDSLLKTSSAGLANPLAKASDMVPKLGQTSQALGDSATKSIESVTSPVTNVAAQATAAAQQATSAVQTTLASAMGLPGILLGGGPTFLKNVALKFQLMVPKFVPGLIVNFGAIAGAIAALKALASGGLSGLFAQVHSSVLGALGDMEKQLTDAAKDATGSALDEIKGLQKQVADARTDVNNSVSVATEASRVADSVSDKVKTEVAGVTNVGKSLENQLDSSVKGIISTPSLMSAGISVPKLPIDSKQLFDVSGAKFGGNLPKIGEVTTTLSKTTVNKFLPKGVSEISAPNSKPPTQLG